MYRSWLLLAGLVIGAPPAARGQQLRAALRTEVGVRWPARRLTPSAASVADTTDKPHRSRAGAAGLGFLAGAAAGLVVAYVVDQSRSSGDGRLENYLGIPLALGTLTFMTVFIAKGD